MDSGDFVTIVIAITAAALVGTVSCVSGKFEGHEQAFNFMCEQKCGSKWATQTTGSDMRQWVCNCPPSETK